MSIDSFPVNDIRQEFLALQKVENNHFVTYLDAASGTQLAKSVVDAMTTYMKNGVSHADGVHTSARETAAIVLRARDHVGQFVGAKKENVVFGANMSTLAIMLSLYMSKCFPNEKKNIVIAKGNHEANVKPWETVAQVKAMDLREIDPTDKGLEADWQTLIDEETALVALDFTSHITGLVNQIDVITSRAKEVGAYVVINANHMLPYFAINFNDMNVDVLLCSGHKVFGPHLGIAIISDYLMERFGDRKDTLEPGTVNYEALVGMIEAVQFIAERAEGASLREEIEAAYQAISMYEAYLINYVKKTLSDFDFVKIHHGYEEHLHVPIIGFEIVGLDSKLAAHYLAQDYAIHVDYGFFHAESYVKELTNNENGLIRMSLAPYNTMEEMERFILAVTSLKEKIE